MSKGLNILLSIMVILFAFWLFTHIWTTRYELKPVGDKGVYMLDTWTGELKLLLGRSYVKVKPE